MSYKQPRKEIKSKISIFSMKRSSASSTSPGENISSVDPVVSSVFSPNNSRIFFASQTVSGMFGFPVEIMTLQSLLNFFFNLSPVHPNAAWHEATRSLSAPEMGRILWTDSNICNINWWCNWICLTGDSISLDGISLIHLHVRDSLAHFHVHTHGRHMHGHLLCLLQQQQHLQQGVWQQQQ